MIGRAPSRDIAVGTRAPRERACTPGRALRKACHRLWRAQRTRAELSALSDPELKDIGLFRGDIGRVSAENYR